MVENATNKRKLNFNKEKKKKARTQRVTLKLADKHKQGKVALVKRTAKNQRREAHRQKMTEAAQLVHGSDAVMTDAAGTKKLSRQQKRQQRRSKDKAAAAAAQADAAAGDGDAEVMQD